MRLLIHQCKHCLRDKTDCDYRIDLLAAIKPIGRLGTLSHNCPVYRTLVPTVSRWGDDGQQLPQSQIIEEARKIGARVQVELKQLEYWESGGTYEPPEPNYEWVSAGKVLGSIVSAPSGKKPFFVVLLDKAAKLNLPIPGHSWDTAQEREIEHRCLPANKLIFVDVIAEDRLRQEELF